MWIFSWLSWGYDRSWFDQDWINRYTWTKFDEDWYDKNWYDEEWYDRDWFDKYWKKKTEKTITHLYDYANNKASSKKSSNKKTVTGKWQKKPKITTWEKPKPNDRNKKTVATDWSQSSVANKEKKIAKTKVAKLEEPEKDIKPEESENFIKINVSEHLVNTNDSVKNENNNTENLDIWTDQNNTLLQKLIEKRREISQNLWNDTWWRIFKAVPISTLIRIAKEKPSNKDALLKYFNNNYDTYGIVGESFLKIINDHLGLEFVPIDKEDTSTSTSYTEKEYQENNITFGNLPKEYQIKKWEDNKEAINFLHLVSKWEKCIFLTGKAWSWKSTIIKDIIDISKKKKNPAIVLWSTWISALNIWWQTIHSFFRIKPAPIYYKDFLRLNTQNSIKKKQIEWLKEAPFVIIDEISMVHSYLIDIIDVLMKRYLKDPRPFWWKQMIFVWDVYQLPPVRKNTWWEQFWWVYKSEWFFDSECFKDLDYTIIELIKNYRQANDNDLANILNHIREQKITDEDIYILNKCQNTIIENDAITLFSRRAKVDFYNQQWLNTLPWKEYHLRWYTLWEFPNDKPVEELVTVKVWAKVIMRSNDTDKYRVNGSFWVIKDIIEEDWEVKELIIEIDWLDCPVYMYEWNNITYELGKDDVFEEVILWSYKQFPVQLAYAITIHKSQWLTFDHCQMELNDVFAWWQAYTALSRVRSLSWLKIKWNVTKEAFYFSTRIFEFKNDIRYMINKVIEDTNTVEEDDQEPVIEEPTVVKNNNENLWDNRTWDDDYKLTFLIDKISIDDLATLFKKDKDYIESRIRFLWIGKISNNKADVQKTNWLIIDYEKYDEEWYDEDWYDKNGFNKAWMHKVTKTRYDEEWFDMLGWDRNDINKITGTIYDVNGYDKFWYNIYWYDKDWYDTEWWNRESYNKYTWTNFDRDWYDKEWYNQNWYNKYWYDREWYDKRWFNINWYDADWYDKNGYDKNGYDKDWYDRFWYNNSGYNTKWINKETWTKFDEEWFDLLWYDRDWYDERWFNKEWIHKNTDTEYDENWYDKNGFDEDWYNEDWYDKEWYDKEWYDKYWYDRSWYNKSWIDKMWYDRRWLRRVFDERDSLSDWNNYHDRTNVFIGLYEDEEEQWESIDTYDEEDKRYN